VGGQPMRACGNIGVAVVRVLGLEGGGMGRAGNQDG